MPFNLHQYQQRNKKTAAQLPNGQTTINLPNGQGPGMGDGVQLTNNEGSPLQDAANKNQIKDIIGDLLYESSMGDGNPERIQSIASGAINADIPPEFSGKDDLVRMVAALGRRASEDPEKVSTNPATGQQEQSIEELASSIANMAGWDTEELINEAKDRKDTENNPVEQEGPPIGMTSPQSGGVPPVRISKKRTPVETTREEDFKEEEKEDPAKKRKKGNPFKVLMGLVGKMLDHGMARREIVKKVTRQEGNKWKPETIEKSIKVVMDARKKEHREKEAMSDKFNLYKYAQVAPNIQEQHRRMAYNKLEMLTYTYDLDLSEKEKVDIVEKALRYAFETDHDVVREKIEKYMNKYLTEYSNHKAMEAEKNENRMLNYSDSKFNLYKYAQKKNVSKDENIKDFEKRKSIYDIPRDIKLMSTMELISRFAYLNGAVNFEVSAANENTAGGKQPDSSLFTKDLKAVKSELSRRNYNDEQIDILSKTVQGRQPEE